MSVNHPDMIRKISLLQEEEDDRVVLTMDCASADLADDLFAIISRAIEEGSISFGGVRFSATKLEEG